MDEALKQALNAAFTANRIAIIGASNKLSSFGGSSFKSYRYKFKGEIIPVNPKDEEIQGVKAYRNVKDIPGEIDFAMIMVAAKFVPQAVKDCAEKGIKIVQIMSSGFGEVGVEGKKIEDEVLQIVQESGMRIIGPNCMGTYVPKIGLSYNTKASYKVGPVSVISQSGGISIDVITRGSVVGVQYNKVVSIGNTMDLKHADFLEYLKEDPETKVIGLYIEGMSDGRRFFEVLKETAKQKPVIILKGGRTEAGAKKASSHTGSLAGGAEVWNAAFAQSGAIVVKSVEELLDTLLAFQNMKQIEGKGIAVTGNGGGATVLASDYAAELNLEFAEFSQGTIERLHELEGSLGGNNVNPNEMPALTLCKGMGAMFGAALRTMAEEKNVGYLMFHLNLLPFANAMDLTEFLTNISKQLKTIDRSETNVVAVLRYNGDPEIEIPSYTVARDILAQGIPVYNTVERGLDAIKKVSVYANTK